MQDRQPYLSDIGGEDGTATTAEPAYSRLHNNFIVANVRLHSISSDTAGLHSSTYLAVVCSMLRTEAAMTM